MPKADAHPNPDAARQLLNDYLSRVQGRDELLRDDGTVKPAWASFIAHLSRFTDEKLQTRFARGDQYLRDAGVLFRQYDETASTERDWPLSHIPVILEDSEWSEISEGLVQRAELLEAVVQDLYGDNTLVSSGQLPAALVAQNPAWLRPLVGVPPAGGHYLNFLSFDIGRGPDGRWWVMGDMVESPSGAGFAIENRVAMSRVFPTYFARSNTHRLAGFFRDFQQSLFDLRGAADGQIALLSPGLMNDSYFEHAYIARYLGMLLVEGEDLVVQGGDVMVRTVAGLKPVSLLWRRVSGKLCDPLELQSDSQLGTPGLIDAIRQQNVHVVNALGAGILETRALMAFLPKISKALLGAPLRLPNIATWWCGSGAERAHVIANRHKMMVGSAFSTRPLIEDKGGIYATAEFSDQKDADIEALLRDQGRELVGQEAVTLSTAPVWEDGKLVPRPMCLRVFMGRTRNGWQVMPGGYARMSTGDDAQAFAMQRGGKVADVWIVSDAPVPKPSLLLGDARAPSNHAFNSALPSRAADNLFWLGRYIERAEIHMRLFRAYFARIRDGASHDAPLLAYMRQTMMQGVGTDGNDLSALFEAPVAEALRAARRVGDRFSTDGLVSLKELAQATTDLHNRDIPVEDTTTLISGLLRQITGFAGLVHENMYRSIGWRFLSIGISIERAANMSMVLSALTDDDAPEGAYDLALEIGDSIISHRLRYAIGATSGTVMDILALDNQNPRAILYHLERAKWHIGELPGNNAGHRLNAVGRQILELETRLAVATPGSVTPQQLLDLRGDIWTLSDMLTSGHLS